MLSPVTPATHSGLWVCTHRIGAVAVNMLHHHSLHLPSGNPHVSPVQSSGCLRLGSKQTAGATSCTGWCQKPSALPPDRRGSLENSTSAAFLSSASCSLWLPSDPWSSVSILWGLRHSGPVVEGWWGRAQESGEPTPKPLTWPWSYLPLSASAPQTSFFPRSDG